MMASINLNYGGPEGTPLDVVVHQYPDWEFKNLTRSTIPLLCYWKDYNTVLPSLCKEVFGTAGSLDGWLCFEYPVSSFGRNKPSFTDAMYVAKERVLGVEGKATEPEDKKTVDKWLKEGKKPKNRRDVLNHWISLIEKHTGAEVRRDSIGEVVNQMLHRTASACSLGKPQSAVLYQWFKTTSGSRKPKVDYLAGLRKLAKAINAGEKLRIWFQEIAATETEAYRRVQQKVNEAKEADCPQIIRGSILTERLFDFEPAELVPVGHQDPQ